MPAIFLLIPIVWNTRSPAMAKTDGEDRWQILGQIENGVFVVITHDRVTREGIEVIRIISARKATSYERQYYFKNRSQF